MTTHHTHPEAARIATERLHILQHALGLDQFGQGRSYRRHFVTGPGSDDWNDCNALVDAGLMTTREPSQISGGDWTFLVTDAGREFVRQHSPSPPKLTRSQRRYEAFLNEDSGLRFGEWLKSESARIARDSRFDAAVCPDCGELASRTIAIGWTFRCDPCKREWGHPQILPRGQAAELLRDARIARDESKTCRKCGGVMAPGKALGQTYTGTPDFAGVEVMTISPGGPGRIIDCSKCTACGWSTT